MFWAEKIVLFFSLGIVIIVSFILFSIYSCCRLRRFDLDESQHDYEALESVV